MEMLAMVHIPRDVREPTNDYLCVKDPMSTPFITPEASEVSQHLQTERYFCPEHGPYMADTDGEMGGCLGCADVKLNISISRDCSYDTLNANNLLDLVLEGAAHAEQDDVLGSFAGIITRSRFDATKELFDYMFAYESGMRAAGDCTEAQQREIQHNFGILKRRRSRNLSKSHSGNLSLFTGSLVRATSKDDFAISYKADEIDILLSREGSERSKSVPEKLNLIADIEGRKSHLWATSLRDISAT